MAPTRCALLFLCVACGSVGESPITSLGVTHAAHATSTRVIPQSLESFNHVDLAALRNDRLSIAERPDLAAGCILAAYHLAQLGLPEEAESFAVTAFAVSPPGSARERVGRIVVEIMLRRLAYESLAGRGTPAPPGQLAPTAVEIGHVLVAEQDFGGLRSLISSQIASGSWAGAIALLRLARATESDLSPIQALDGQVSRARTNQIDRVLSEWRHGNIASALSEHRTLAEFATDSDSLRVWLIQRYIMTQKDAMAIDATKRWFPDTGAKLWQTDPLIASMAALEEK